MSSRLDALASTAPDVVAAWRCGEWLLFSDVHDLLHLEQLEQLETMEASLA